MGKLGYPDRWKGENVLDSPVTFPSVRGRNLTLSNRIVLHDSACSALHYSIFLVQQLERMLRMEGNFLKFQCRGHHPYWGKNFQTESIVDAIGDDILLDNRTG
jgi:hypothetical protein